MSRKVTFYIVGILLSILVLTVGCEKAIEEQPTVNSFEIYLATLESVSEFGYFDYENLVLEENPILTDNDIRAYYWMNHEIELTSTYIDKINDNPGGNVLYQDNGSFRQYEQGGSRLLKAFQYDCFVIVINGERVYSGTFSYSPIMSYPQEPLIIGDISNTSFQFIFTGIGEDPRNTDVMYNYFLSEDKLRINDANNLEKRIEELERTIDTLLDEKVILLDDKELLLEQLSKSQDAKSYYENLSRWLNERVYWYMVEVTPKNTLTNKYSFYLSSLNQLDFDSVSEAAMANSEYINDLPWDRDRLFNLFETYYYSVMHTAELNIQVADLTDALLQKAEANGILLYDSDGVVIALPKPGYLLNGFSIFITKATEQYLHSVDLETNMILDSGNYQLVKNGAITLSLNKLADLIIIWEDYCYNYGLKYLNLPYHYKGAERVVRYFNYYTGKTYMLNNPVFNESKELSESFKISYEYTIFTYPDSKTGIMVNEFYTILQDNSFVRDLRIDDFYMSSKYDLLY